MVLSQRECKELAETARALCVRGKGILAADESTGTCKKRFDAINLTNSEENRASYRNLLFSTPNLSQFISGVILFEETLFQNNSQGVPLVDLLKKQNIIPGIKVDKGLESLAQTDDEKATLGLDTLNDLASRAYKKGARFAKWRAVYSIDKESGKPSCIAIKENAYLLARYAATCQSNGLVPIIEPEVLNDGSHTIEECANITEKVLKNVIMALFDYGVLLEGSLLKTNMVLAGSEREKEKPDIVAFYTIRTLRRTIPPSIPGVMFLSGGQSEEDASVNLNAMNQDQFHPWVLSFSFGRALQSSCLKTWLGKSDKQEKAQKVLIERCKANSEAQLGKYKGGAGGENSSASLFEKKYIY